MTDEDQDARLQRFFDRQDVKRADPTCRACHKHPALFPMGLCAACDAKATQRWALTPTPAESE